MKEDDLRNISKEDFLKINNNIIVISSDVKIFDSNSKFY